jgi:hypothetical protein
VTSKERGRCYEQRPESETSMAKRSKKGKRKQADFWTVWNALVNTARLFVELLKR